MVAYLSRHRCVKTWKNGEKYCQYCRGLKPPWLICEGWFRVKFNPDAPVLCNQSADWPCSWFRLSVWLWLWSTVETSIRRRTSRSVKQSCWTRYVPEDIARLHPAHGEFEISRDASGHYRWVIMCIATRSPQFILLFVRRYVSQTNLEMISWLTVSYY